MNQVTSTISNFNLKRKLILSKLEYLNEVLVEQGLDSESLVEVKKRLINNSFSIIVVGEFSSGKSTFINALLREKILPAKVRPTTAIINVIEDGEPEATVFYKDKQVKKISIDEIQSFATALNEQGKEEASKIEHMLIKYPCAYTKEGVKIIDTPGVEDLDKAREEITYEMIPKADTAILLLDSRRALKNSERVFLKEKILGNNINKLFFILNFADAICDTNKKPSDEKLQVIINKVKEDLKSITGKLDIEVYPISAKRAILESKAEDEGHFTKMLNTFERELQEFLIKEKGQVLLNNSVVRANSIIDETLRVINFKITSLNNPLEELKLKENELNEIIERIRCDKLLIMQDVNKAINDLLVILTPEIQAIVGSVISKLEEIDVSENNSDIESFYKSKFKDLMIKEMDSSINMKLQENIKTIVIQTEKRLSLILKELNNFMNIDMIDNNFNVDEVSVESDLNENDIALKQLAMGVGAYLGVPFILGLFNPATIVVIPLVVVGYILSGMAIFKWGNMYKKNAVIKEIQKARVDIVKNIESQIKDKLIQTSSDYCKAIDELIEKKITDTYIALEQVIQEKEKLSVEEENMIKSLGGLEFKLNNLKAQLNKIIEGTVL